MHKISLFLPSLRGGGAEKAMLKLAKGLAEKGLHVDLVLVKAEGSYLSSVPQNVRVVDLKTKRVLFSLLSLVRYLRKERPEAMISTLNHANIVALWARRIAKVPTRLVVREATTIGINAKNSVTQRGKLIPFFIRIFYKWGDAVVTNSRGAANDLIRIAKLPIKKVNIIYNPVVSSELFTKAEEPLNHPWFAPGSPPVILGVGRLTPAKDFDSLIRAFALVCKDRPARLIILGEGKERPKLEALLKKLDLQGKVSLPGFVDNPYKYMKRAALFVLSSKWEGLPTVLIEALALGTPVVSTDCPSGPIEILENGKHGKLVPVGNVETMASAILETLSQFSLPVASFNAYTLETVVNQYLELLSRV